MPSLLSHRLCLWHLPLIAICSLVAPLVFASPPRPLGPPILARVSQKYSSALAIVTPLESSVPIHRLVATFVSGQGHLLTSSPSLQLDQLVRLELPQGDLLLALVIARDSTDLVLLKVLPSASASSSSPPAPRWTFLPAPSSFLSRPPSKWLVSFDLSPRGHLFPTVGSTAVVPAADWLLDIPAIPGAPVIDGKGHLVGLISHRRRPSQSSSYTSSQLFSFLRQTLSAPRISPAAAIPPTD